MKNNFVPLGGKSRNYKNTKTGEIISRRQYDKQYGSLAKTGFKTYEDKARAAKIIDERRQLLRPARGRKALSIVGKTPTEVEHEIVERKIKKYNRHIPTPDVSKVKLQRGKKSAYVICDWSFEGIKAVIDQINKMSEKKMWAYFIGVTGIDADGVKRDIAVLPSEHFQEVFTEEKWERAQYVLDNPKLRKTGSDQPLTPIHAFVRMSFDADYAMKNAITIPTRKKRINAKKASNDLSKKKRKKR